MSLDTPRNLTLPHGPHGLERRLQPAPTAARPRNRTTPTSPTAKTPRNLTLPHNPHGLERRLQPAPAAARPRNSTAPTSPTAKTPRHLTPPTPRGWGPPPPPAPAAPRPAEQHRPNPPHSQDPSKPHPPARPKRLGTPASAGTRCARAQRNGAVPPILAAPPEESSRIRCYSVAFFHGAAHDRQGFDFTDGLPPGCIASRKPFCPRGTSPTAEPVIPVSLRVSAAWQARERFCTSRSPKALR